MRRLRNLVDGLPPSARVRSETPDEPWGVLEELVAQLIEEVSILTADRRRKKPVEVLRPAKKVASDRRSSSGDKGAIPAMKHGGLLAAAVGAGRVSSRG